MCKPKIRLVDKQRFYTFLLGIGLAVLLGISIRNPTQGTIKQWHEACENGVSWQEYMEGVQE